jgi:hypothetical protein
MHAPELTRITDGTRGIGDRVHPRAADECNTSWREQAIDRGARHAATRASKTRGRSGVTRCILTPPQFYLTGPWSHLRSIGRRGDKLCDRTSYIKRKGRSRHGFHLMYV